MDNAALTIAGNFEVKPCECAIDFSDPKRFQKLPLTQTQKMQVSAALQQIPALAAEGAMSHAYILRFPEGLPHTLIKLGQGGYGATISDHGKFVGTASLYSAATPAVCMGAFTAMSIASGQYFLSMINEDLTMIGSKLDEILEFLYGDKKAELMAEISFVRYAYQNYTSIMECSEQRIATITSLQGARKIAMKDIEFYINDLASIVKEKDKVKDISGVKTIVDKIVQIKGCLMLSMQLYAIGNLLEVYYSQNRDSAYVSYIESDVSAYIDKCDKRMLSSFNQLYGSFANLKDKLWKKIDLTSYEKQISIIVDDLTDGEVSSIKATFCEALSAPNRDTEYYFDDAGVVYLKIS